MDSAFTVAFNPRYDPLLAVRWSLMPLARPVVALLAWPAWLCGLRDAPEWRWCWGTVWPSWALHACCPDAAVSLMEFGKG